MGGDHRAQKQTLWPSFNLLGLFLVFFDRFKSFRTLQNLQPRPILLGFSAIISYIFWSPFSLGSILSSCRCNQPQSLKCSFRSTRVLCLGNWLEKQWFLYFFYLRKFTIIWRGLEIVCKLCESSTNSSVELLRQMLLRPYECDLGDIGSNSIEDFSSFEYIISVHSTFQL